MPCGKCMFYFFNLSMLENLKKRSKILLKVQNISQLSLVYPPYPLAASSGTDKARRGALRPTLEDSARTKRFGRETRGSRIPY